MTENYCALFMATQRLHLRHLAGLQAPESSFGGVELGTFDPWRLSPKMLDFVWQRISNHSTWQHGECMARLLAEFKRRESCKVRIEVLKFDFVWQSTSVEQHKDLSFDR
jgi:hypothetical protein